MPRSITVITPYSELQLRNIRPFIESAWMNRRGEWHNYIGAVARLHPGAAEAAASDWEAVFGSGPQPIPHPGAEDPRSVELRRHRRLRALGDPPTDPSRLDYWLFQLNADRIRSGTEPVREGAPHSAERIAWARRSQIDDEHAARVLRDQWTLQQARAQAQNHEDAKSVEQALDAAHALETRLTAERDTWLELQLEALAPADEAAA